MKNQVHYEDNLFYLNLQTKLLKEALSLSVDSEFFLGKILFDLRFIDATLDKLHRTLEENPHLIRRAEYFHNLIKTQTSFVDLLSDITLGKLAFSEFLTASVEEIRTILDRNNASLRDARNLLRSMSEQPEENEDVITADELQLLMKTDEEDEDD